MPVPKSQNSLYDNVLRPETTSTGHSRAEGSVKSANISAAHLGCTGLLIVLGQAIHGILVPDYPCPASAFADDESRCLRLFERRRFLGQLGAGFGTLAFEALLHEQARAAAPNHPAGDRSASALCAAPTSFRAASQVGDLYLSLVGGPSQVDTFDYKPELTTTQAARQLPPSLRQAIERTKFANVTHGCEAKTARQSLYVAAIRRIGNVGQRAVSACCSARR